MPTTMAASWRPTAIAITGGSPKSRVSTIPRTSSTTTRTSVPRPSATVADPWPGRLDARRSRLAQRDDDDLVERRDGRDLADFDDAGGRREQVLTVHHEGADAEDRERDEGADHSMNPEFPAVHEGVLFSGRRCSL